MKKFTKIVESKEDILSNIDISEDDIIELCQEFVDEFDYSLSISSEYINKNGRISRGPNQSSEYYPSLILNFKRKDLEKDYRYYNGGVKYENNSYILKILYETIKRIESIIESKDNLVLYTIRSLDDISIRVTTKVIKSEVGTIIENIKKSIPKLSTSYLDDEYECVDNFSHGETNQFQIKLKYREYHKNYKDMNDNIPFDRVLKRSIESSNSGSPDNSNDLIKISNIIIKRIIDSIVVEDIKLSDVSYSYYNSFEELISKHIDIKIKNKSYLKLWSNVSEDDKYHIVIGQSLFKNVIKTVKTFGLYFNITINEEIN